MNTDAKDEVISLLFPSSIITLKGAGLADGKWVDRFGVLVAGEMVLAARLELIEYDIGNDWSELHSFLPVDATTKNGDDLKLDVLFADAVSGLVVLGSLDAQRFSGEPYDYATQFTDFCESATPTCLNYWSFKDAHTDNVIAGSVIRPDLQLRKPIKLLGLCHPDSSYFFTEDFTSLQGKSDKQILEDLDIAFAAPVLDVAGALLGFVTHGVHVARPHRLLPPHLAEQIIEAQEDLQKGIQNE